MSYLKVYGKKRKLQEGGAMPAGPAVSPAAGPEAAPGGGGGEQEAQVILQLAEATMGGDEQAAAELGKMLAPVIMQEVQAQGGGAEAAPAGGAPVFRRGGQFLGRE